MQKHEEWLLKAKGDLLSSKKLVQGDDETLDSAVYHTQQCAEKALKSFLVYKKQKICRTHDLDLLVKICTKLDQDFEQLVEIVEMLNPFGFQFRYPGELSVPELDDVLVAINDAEKVLNFVRKKVCV